MILPHISDPDSSSPHVNQFVFVLQTTCPSPSLAFLIQSYCLSPGRAPEGRISASRLKPSLNSCHCLISPQSPFSSSLFCTDTQLRLQLTSLWELCRNVLEQSSRDRQNLSIGHSRSSATSEQAYLIQGILTRKELIREILYICIALITMAYILYIYIYDRHIYLTYLDFYISPSIRMQISWKHRFLLYSLLLPKLLRRVPNIYIRYSINIWWIIEWITEWIYIQSQSEILCFLYVYRCPVLVSCKRNHFWFSQRGIYWDAIMELPELSKIGEIDLENKYRSVVTMMARKWEWPEHSDHTGNKKPQLSQCSSLYSRVQFQRGAVSERGWPPGHWRMASDYRQHTLQGIC